ncbi:hypothetical protein KUCAC02_010099 [Chaenocephalus aceratus]|uniref:Uncharacterized protein n=1 Tax=Chaenocephalus aceratus TaxID=36190 RepID=A0ACB9VZN4_CHAAC|nr:hypothetical protein KUCAC02_010099 [Chaenocephalus aceratus]
MTALLWMLALLPRVLLSHVLPAMIKLPLPVNINLTSSHFKHELRWEPGPGTPTGVYYQVAVKTDRGTIWVPVASCQHVQSPLVCNLTEAFPVRDQLYFTSISALLDSQPGEVTVVIHPGFEPIKNTALDLPLLTVTPCGQVLCVDPRPPVEHLRVFYDNLHYKLRIQSNNANNAQSFVDTQSLERVILKDLASGRQYCVSVRISDVWASRKSNYSQPVCAFTPAHYTADPWISAFFILLVICALVVLALMLYTGSICLTQRPLPSVLRSIHHIEERTVVPSCNSSVSSLLNLEPAAPPSGEKSSCHSSDESDEEESPLPGQTVCDNTSPPAETCTSAGLHPAPPSPTDTHCSTRGTKVQGGGGSPEVNLLTLTFGSHVEGEEEKSHVDTVEVEAQAADNREGANNGTWPGEKSPCHDLMVCVSLPAPSKVSISSLNMEHTLSFLPGPGTPPDARFTVQVLRLRKSQWRLLAACAQLTAGQKCNLTRAFKDRYEQYQARVQAFTLSQTSNWTVSEKFLPLTDTVLGPPDVSLSGCGDCLLLRLGAPIAMEISPTYRVHVQRTRDGVQVRGDCSLRV